MLIHGVALHGLDVTQCLGDMSQRKSERQRGEEKSSIQHTWFCCYCLSPSELNSCPEAHHA